jgi:ethanolamine ammonia-lyase small subunit
MDDGRVPAVADEGGVIENPWQSLRALTPARIALGRAGVSQPTGHHLAFQLAHARARDAVYSELDITRLRRELQVAGHQTIDVASAASDRSTYLQRPDLGRKLDPQSVDRLQQRGRDTFDVAFVIADGLSALAVQRHAVPFLAAVVARLDVADWRLAPVTIVEHGRVAVSDDVGALLGANLAVILIGERPGLSSPDSLGIYLTWNPQIGNSDADRNCISNIHAAGLSYDEAARKLVYLMTEARRRAVSGVLLKDDSAALADTATTDRSLN